MMKSFIGIMMDVLTFGDFKKNKRRKHIAILDYIAVIVTLATAIAILMFFITGSSEGVINILIAYLVVQILYRLIDY